MPPWAQSQAIAPVHPFASLLVVCDRTLQPAELAAQVATILNLAQPAQPPAEQQGGQQAGQPKGATLDQARFSVVDPALWNAKPESAFVKGVFDSAVRIVTPLLGADGTVNPAHLTLLADLVCKGMGVSMGRAKSTVQTLLKRIAKDPAPTTAAAAGGAGAGAGGHGAGAGGATPMDTRDAEKEEEDVPDLVAAVFGQQPAPDAFNAQQQLIEMLNKGGQFTGSSTSSGSGGDELQAVVVLQGGTRHASTSSMQNKFVDALRMVDEKMAIAIKSGRWKLAYQLLAQRIRLESTFNNEFVPLTQLLGEKAASEMWQKSPFNSGITPEQRTLISGLAREGKFAEIFRTALAQMGFIVNATSKLDSKAAKRAAPASVPQQTAKAKAGAAGDQAGCAFCKQAGKDYWAGHSILDCRQLAAAQAARTAAAEKAKPKADN